MAVPDYDAFLKELYACKLCVDERRRFAVPTPDGKPRRGWNKFRTSSAANAPYKFPPIGFGQRPLLFIAINPRFTDNVRIHDEVMSSLQSFTAFSQNRVFGGQYIRPESRAANEPRERFYDDQLRIASATFPNQPFEDVACSAEMYFCATADADGLFCHNSPCAKQYLRQLIDAYVKPQVIVTFGNQIPQFFKKNISGVGASVIHLPFRSSWSVTNIETMDSAVEWATRAVDALFTGAHVPPRNWTWPSSHVPQPVEKY